jgi:transposase
MVKPIGQAPNSPAKELVFKYGPKSSQFLHTINNVTDNRNKITKRKAPTSNKGALKESSTNIRAQESPSEPSQVKAKYQGVTAEQIKQLIHHIENDKMTIGDASRTVNMDEASAYRYYQMYKKDPKQRIPAPGRQPNSCTYDQIKALISYIVDDKMTISAASIKANVCLSTGRKYYSKYLNDPNKNIPRPERDSDRNYTREQLKKFIDFIINDKMSISKAATQLGMCIETGRRYYHKYMKDPNHDVPVPEKRRTPPGKPCTFEQVKNLISYIEQDQMSVADASRKANMGVTSGKRYYFKYLNDPDRNIPVAEKPFSRGGNVCTYEEVKNLISYLVDDHMNFREASIKANISEHTAKKYYREYLEDPNHEIPVPTKHYSAPTYHQIKDLISYIVDGNLSVSVAATKVRMNKKTAQTYYNRYVNDPENHIPIPRTHKDYICEPVKSIIDWTPDSAAPVATQNKVNQTYDTVFYYYNKTHD